MGNTRPARLCRRCKRIRPYRGKGLCESCGGRRPYVPTGVGRGAPGVARTRQDVEGRLAEFAELRAQRDATGRRVYSIAAAARRIGVSDRTGERYSARLRERGD